MKKILLLLATLAAQPAWAQDTIKIGLVTALSFQTSIWTILPRRTT